MRKTSHDGADSSSITSGIDNETKKFTTNFNKMKKSSIKRKVQNFSHDSDDGIIEPLLQNDKEKIEIANRSAKYLLNKSKTESLNEKDNKVTDGYADKYSIPIPISSTSNMITNNVKDSSISTSYICGAAPIHNHMNTNIFNAYDASTGSITTKNPILVEIDTSKPGRYSPSPLIFTTAKIHTDCKTKLMEPVQVTPVPILSTTEGNIVKAGVVSNSETKAFSLSKTSSESTKFLSGKSEINILPPCKDKTFSPTNFSNENVKNEPNATNSLDCVNLFYKDEKLSQFLDTASKSKLANNDTTVLKGQTIIGVPTAHNISILTTEISKSPACSKNISEKCSLIDKSNERFRDNINNEISQAPVDLKNQEDIHKINLKTPDEQKSHFISKDSKIDKNTSASGNKKLQRQMNALTEVTNDSVNKISIPFTQSYVKEAENNISTKSEQVALPEQDHKSDFAARITLPENTKISYTNICTAHQPKGICITTLASTEIKPAPSTVLPSTSKVISVTETVNLNPTDVCQEVSNYLSKSTTVTHQSKESKESSAASIKLTSAGPLINSKLTAIPVSVKPVILSSSSCSSQSVKTDPSIKCTVTTVNTTLPSYIVSTSKTKIGSTLTSGTSAITSKPQMQKPLVSVNTTSAHVKSFTSSGVKSSPSTSATNGTKHTIFSKETKSKPDTIKKGGKA